MLCAFMLVSSIIADDMFKVSLRKQYTNSMDILEDNSMLNANSTHLRRLKKDNGARLKSNLRNFRNFQYLAKLWFLYSEPISQLELGIGINLPWLFAYTEKCHNCPSIHPLPISQLHN